MQLHALPHSPARLLEARFQPEESGTLWLTLPASIDGQPPSEFPATCALDTPRWRMR